MQLTNKIPYMTRRHFIVLADELGVDKFYYKSEIVYHEKLERMIKYCQQSNARFNLDTFKARIDKSFNEIKAEASRTVGGTI
mgnify:FL=1